MGIKYKICNECGIRKSQKFFRKDPNSPDGLRTKCKCCDGVVSVRNQEYPFFTSGIVKMCREHKYIEVKKFGYFYGVLIKIRNNEYLAFSTFCDTQTGSKVVNSHKEGRLWLYKQAILCGDRTTAGFARGI